jgi:hypothetical protein
MATTMIKLAITLAFSLVAFTMPTLVWAAGPTLTVSADGGVHTFDRDELLARTDVVEITTSHTVLLGRIEPWRSRSYLKELPFRPMPWWKRQRKTAS